jgi:transcriptional regulator with XRE-family HTH domain
MKLGELIAEYRKEHNLSQRQFAKKCGGLSNGYVSMLENDFNPATNKGITPSIDKLMSIAAGMDMTLHRLCEIVDDTPVYVGSEQKDTSEEQQNFSAKALEIARAYEMMSDYGRAIIDFIVAQEEKRKRESYGKPKILSSGYKAVPMFHGKDDAELFMEYTAKRELMELSEEESPTAIKPDA